MIVDRKFCSEITDLWTKVVELDHFHLQNNNNNKMSLDHGFKEAERNFLPKAETFVWIIVPNVSVVHNEGFNDQTILHTVHIAGNKKYLGIL